MSGANVRDVFPRCRRVLSLAGVFLAGTVSVTAARAQGPSALALPSAQAGSGVSTTPAEAPELLALRHLIDTGHSADALGQIDGIAAQPGAPPGLDRLRGLALYAQNNVAPAEAAFAAAIQQDPHDLESTQMDALCLFRLGRPAAAIPLLESAHKPGSQTKVDPTYILALCYLDTRRYDDARHAFAAQYGFPPDSASAYLLAARMLLRREYVPIAQNFANRALELDPKLPLAHALLGEIALAGNHLPEAIAQFEEERARNPLNPSTYDRLGDAYSRQGNYTEALLALQRAVLLEPNSTGPYILLGKVHLKQGDFVGAVTFLERAEKMDPANFMTHSLLGQAYRGLGRREDASRETATATRIQAADEPKLDAPR